MQSPLVITGMGMISPLGCGVKASWERLLAGRSGISPITRFDTADLPIKVAGSVPDIESDPGAGFDPDRVLDAKERRKLELFSLYAMAAAEEALSQADWFPTSDAEREATATIVGSGIGGFPTITQAQTTLTSRGHRRLSPFTVPAFLANLAAGNVSIRYGFRGPLGCPVTACAAGVQAIGDGMRLIRSGEADVALVGGAEACIDPLSLASFHAMKALSPEQDDPTKASRPFDQARNGFVMGEGAGLMVIESLAHAEARGATPLAILSGYGTSSDAHHITAGPEDGAGAAAAIRSALKMAGLSPEAIDHINAHATSTPVGDRAEIASLRNAFGDALPGIPISATKSATGHLLGAAGGVESIFSALSAMHDRLPPTLNLEHVDDDLHDLEFVASSAREHRSQHVLCNGFGFGGVNAALIVSKV
ncbi:beta-ketoacyl-ACP synthase II [Aidingimonas halophila]|uniref:3-oxoacyl-[acyl-carrier-protein] synthase 2 n=1 Tax=Aidingimonas halophila TaxID=574349 RepID=A0A1H2Q695_9GAMM|nr:beta-ketoacyl-ACP synthase II [Aidingimonas halophila]GHC21120.1 3-oxoacyl-[acyl-carrier-protein] synthase 2 [Aidingimonas halophila]SDW02683.1 3-oxoacyl-[acyl-carrier-protein] synthase II [Aidingimonas halophila]